MYAVAHLVGFERAFEFNKQRRAIQSNVQADLAGTPVQAVKMLLDEQQAAFVKANTFPNAIAHQETGIEQRYFGFRARYQPPVERDQGLGITGIRMEVLAASHQPLV